MTTELARSLLNGDRRALAQAITLVESTRPDHRRQAEALMTEVLPATGESLRIGVTGAPGVGKSTFIDTFGTMVAEDGRKLAVLAVDPSSTSGGGSILGDKTRMGGLATNPDVFVRPSPSGGSLGGIGSRTRDAIALCEACGYDTVLVETVGVGQSETTVATVTDLFLLLVAPGGGDDLQGIKRGVMELADMVVINKADGNMMDLAKQTEADYRLALHLVRPKRPGYETEVLTCSSLSGDGQDEVWSRLDQLHRSLKESGELQAQRRNQAVAQLEAEVSSALMARADRNQEFTAARSRFEKAVADQEISVTEASAKLLDLVFGAG